MSETRGWSWKAGVLGAAVVLGVAIVMSVGGTVATAAKPQPPRFVDNGNGTISDRQTGLMWEKKTACEIPSAADIHCLNNTYSWSSAENGTAPDGTLFTDFLERINKKLSTSPDGITVADVCLAGHCDWRIPNISELRTILDLGATGCGGGSPCINPIFGSTAAFYHWSSSSDSVVPETAWFVSFGGDFVDALGKEFAVHARAVRGGS